MPYIEGSADQVCDDCGAKCRAAGITPETAHDLPCYAVNQERTQVWCQVCAAKRELSDLLERGRGIAYVQEVKDKPGTYNLTTWAGEVLSTRPTSVYNTFHNLGHKVSMLYFMVKDDPHLWSARWYRNSGEYVHLRRLKEKWR